MDPENQAPTTSQQMPQAPETPQKSSLSKIITIILAALVFVGCIYGAYYLGTKKAPVSQNTAVQISPTVTTTPTSSFTPTTSPQVSSTPTVDMKTQIKERVLQFYSDYAQGQLGGVYQKGYLTVDAYTALQNIHGYDPVLCTQGGSPSPLTVDSVTITGQTATVVAKQYYEASKTYNAITLNMNTSDQKISSITCNF